MNRVALTASLSQRPSQNGRELAELPSAVRWLEVRAGLTGDLDPVWLRSHFSGGLIYSLRGFEDEGRVGSAGQRLERLARAAQQYDLVELEAEHDLTPELLALVPAAKRLITWHSPAAASPDELRLRLRHLSGFEARFYKLVPTAATTSDGLAPLCLLRSSKRSDVIAYAGGLPGYWSRMVAPYMGSALAFGEAVNVDGVTSAPPVSKLIEDYGLPKLAPLTELCGIVGDPILHSLSPRLHNAAYRALNRPALYVPFHAASFRDFWRDVVHSKALASLGLRIKGLTVASPHKEAALDEVELKSRIVKRAGSTNLLVNEGSQWLADTTDPEGVVATLQERAIAPTGKRAAIIGCGGAGRAVAAALALAGADVTLVNRSAPRGLLAAELLGLPLEPLSTFSAVGFSIVVNATPLGRDDGLLPFDPDKLSGDAVVVDLAYGSRPTPLVVKAQSKRLTVIDGRAVLLKQVRRQFRLMIGQEMPHTPAEAQLNGHDDPNAIARSTSSDSESHMNRMINDEVYTS